MNKFYAMNLRKFLLALVTSRGSGSEFGGNSEFNMLPMATSVGNSKWPKNISKVYHFYFENNLMYILHVFG